MHKQVIHIHLTRIGTVRRGGADGGAIPWIEEWYLFHWAGLGSGSALLSCQLRLRFGLGDRRFRTRLAIEGLHTRGGQIFRASSVIRLVSLLRFLLLLFFGLLPLLLFFLLLFLLLLVVPRVPLGLLLLLLLLLLFLLLFLLLLVVTHPGQPNWIRIPDFSASMDVRAARQMPVRRVEGPHHETKLLGSSVNRCCCNTKLQSATTIHDDFFSTPFSSW